MKKTLAIAASFAIAAAATLATPVVAQDKGPARDVVEFCDQFGNDLNGPGLPTAGSCVSFFRSGGGANAVSFCKQLKDFGALGFFGFKSQGECIVTLSS
jgi:hypothetical protein